MDRWLNIGPIRQLIHGPLPRDIVNLRIKDVATPYGWDWSVIPFELPDNLKSEIQAIPIPILTRGIDKIAWSPSPKGTFDLKSAYCLAINPLKTETFAGKWIWKLNTLPRIQMFVWKCMHGSIGVKECLLGRGISLDPTCPLCHLEAESISHALRDCICIKPIWAQLHRQALSPSFFTQSTREWLLSNCHDMTSYMADLPPWNSIFLFAIWIIWKQRNLLVFKNKGFNPNIVQEIIMQSNEFVHCAGRWKHRRQGVVKSICWEKPEKGWLKLNTDGAANGVLGLAGGGGVVRDENGNWVIGFSRRLGKASSFLAELWALRDGLLLCQQLNSPKIIVEMDAKSLVDAFNNPSYTNTVISPLFEDCRQLMLQLPHCRIKHIFREANGCADRLANIGCLQAMDFIVYSSPPVDVLCLVVADSHGFCTNRVCPAV